MVCPTPVIRAKVVEPAALCGRPAGFGPPAVHATTPAGAELHRCSVPPKTAPAAASAWSLPARNRAETAPQGVKTWNRQRPPA